MELKSSCPLRVFPAVGDFDDDGFLDVFFGVFNSADKIFFGDIDASFSRSISISVIPQGQGENRVSGAAAIDFNQDGKLDVFVTHIHGVPGRVMINNGEGNFTHLRDSSISTVQRHLEVADFDNDGLPDLLDSMRAGVNFLKPEGGIQPTAGVHQAGGGMLGHQPSGGPLALGDLNGDGLEDVMILHSTDGGESDKTGAFVLHNADGTGKFNFLTILGRGEHIFKAGDIGDIDNDGDGDITLLKSNGSRLLIYQNHGDGNFSLFDPEIEFTGASDLTFVDYDQDGVLELAISGPQIMVENLGMQNLANDLFTMGEDGVLRTATVFDFERNASSYVIRVQATDEHNLSVEKNFTVTLLNEDDNISPAELHSIGPLIAEENQPIGAVIGQFTAEDPDGDDLTFHFVSGENNNSHFTSRYQWNFESRPVV